MSQALTDPALGGVAISGSTQGAIDNTVFLVANNQQLTGWTDIRVTRGCERVPMDFDIALTDRFPGKPVALIKPGDPCQLKIGADLVITGYVDRYMPSLTAGEHGIRITGRSRVQDLVDCSAGINKEGLSPGFQISTTSLLDLFKQLSITENFGVTGAVVGGADVNLVAGGPNGGPFTFNITLTETPMEILEEVARYAKVLLYDGPDGNLIFSAVGATSMASGFQQGVNVQDARATFTQDERFSEYMPSLTSIDSVYQYPGSVYIYTPVTDTGVLRFRPKIVVSEQSVFGIPLAQARAVWEMNRRYGRASMVQLTCDSWRDSAGKLWQPNAYVTVDIPALGILSKHWIIASVSFLRSLREGSVANLTLMPAQAFAIEPSTLQPTDWQITDDLTYGGGGQAPAQNWGPANLNAPPPILP